MPGTLDHLIDELRDKYNRPLPGADLLLSNVYDQLMPDVIDAKDLGSGVIGGVECDHLAFRTDEVDWQIWIARGDRRRGAAIQPPDRRLEDRKRGCIERFRLQQSVERRKIDLKDLPDADLPEHFVTGGAQ